MAHKLWARQLGHKTQAQLWSPSPQPLHLLLPLCSAGCSPSPVHASSYLLLGLHLGLFFVPKPLNTGVRGFHPWLQGCSHLVPGLNYYAWASKSVSPANLLTGFSNWSIVTPTDASIQCTLLTLTTLHCSHLVCLPILCIVVSAVPNRGVARDRCSLSIMNSCITSGRSRNSPWSVSSPGEWQSWSRGTEVCYSLQAALQ